MRWPKMSLKLVLNFRLTMKIEVLIVHEKNKYLFAINTQEKSLYNLCLFECFFQNTE